MHDSLFTISTVVEQSLPFCVIVVLVGEYGDSIFETGVLIGENGDSILWDGRFGLYFGLRLSFPGVRPSG